MQCMKKKLWINLGNSPEEQNAFKTVKHNKEVKQYKSR